MDVVVFESLLGPAAAAAAVDAVSTSTFEPIWTGFGGLLLRARSESRFESRWPTAACDRDGAADVADDGDGVADGQDDQAVEVAVEVEDAITPRSTPCCNC